MTRRAVIVASTSRTHSSTTGDGPPGGVGDSWQTRRVTAAAGDVLAGLDEQQRQAAEALDGPVAIIAGAGSGKTRVITHRIAYGVLTGAHDPTRSVAVTFTTKAAGEMTRRLRMLGVPQVRVRTFHAAALRQLRHYYPRVLNRDLPEVTPVKAPLVGGAARAMRVPGHTAAVRDFAAEIEWAKVNSITAAGYAAAAQEHRRTPPADLTPTAMGELYAEYERRKTDAGRIDFEDVLLLMVALLDSQPQVARHVRAGLAHLTVDEYQDASPLQQRLLDGWLGNNDNLCVVGDPAQTIYTFAGADATLLTGFARRYPQATVIRLPRTYRCTPEIVSVANRVLAPAREGVTLVADRPSGLAVRVRDYADPDAEAAGVTARIKTLIDAGTPAHEIAVLVRMNAMTAPFEQALTEAGIGYAVSGGTGFFHRAEVRQAVAVIRAAALSPAAATEYPADVSDDPDERALPTEVAALLSGLGWTPTPPLGAGAARDRWESWSALHGAAEKLAREHPAAGLADFAQELAERAERADAPDSAGVTLASLHAAKGAEWDAVFLVGMVEGVLPHGSAQTDEEVAEERRLAYVGITRARDVLELSYPRTRSGGNSGSRPRTPSRFLDPLLDRSTTRSAPRAGAQPKSAASRRRAAPAVCRVCGAALVTGAERALTRCQTCPGEADVALVERLREWRSATAAELGRAKGSRMPAYIVATDATLQAIAERQPANIDELAEIPGIGPRKVEAYGEQILAVLAASD